MGLFLCKNSLKEFICLPTFVCHWLVPVYDSDISFFDNEPVCLLFWHDFPLFSRHLTDIDKPDIVIGCLFLSIC